MRSTFRAIDWGGVGGLGAWAESKDKRDGGREDRALRCQVRENIHF